MSHARQLRLERMLATHGLTLLGRLGPVDEDSIQARELWLAGNAGPGMWQRFRESAEFADGRPDPLDRWTVRIGNAVATALGACVVYPFRGPPYPPFQRWALQSGEAFASPLGITLHRNYGLWHGYRFALAFDDVAGEAESGPTVRSPCDGCAGHPCLGACPAGAFDGNGYRVEDCAAWLRAHPDGDCMQSGCAARRACPAGHEWTYQPEQAAFHMRAFLF